MEKESMRTQKGEVGEATLAKLLSSARAGDSSALDQLCERCLPKLRHWVNLRFGGPTRESLDIERLIRTSVASTVRHLQEQPGQHPVFHAWLRQSLSARIQEEIGQVQTRASTETSTSPQAVRLETSPLLRAIGSEGLQRYEEALQKLGPKQQEAVVAWGEIGVSFTELAGLIGEPSPDAARAAVRSALIALAQAMENGQQ